MLLEYFSPLISVQINAGCRCRCSACGVYNSRELYFIQHPLTNGYTMILCRFLGLILFHALLARGTKMWHLGCQVGCQIPLKAQVLSN